MNIVEFLQARIHEDEALARMAFGDHNDNGPHWDEPWSGAVDMKSEDQEFLLTNDSGVSRHIVNWDPGRALRECRAKRSILEFHESWPVLAETQPEIAEDDPAVYRITKQIAWMTEREYRNRFGDEPPTGPMILALASIYADHEDFEKEWLT